MFASLFAQLARRVVLVDPAEGLLIRPDLGQRWVVDEVQDAVECAWRREDAAGQVGRVKEDADFPVELLPDHTGLILADGYGAEILRVGLEARLAPARRKVIVQTFARHAAIRLQALRDPRPPKFNTPAVAAV